MKKTIFFVFFSSILSVCFSQTTFIKLLYDNNALAVHDASRPICRTHDGNYAITSYGFYNSICNYLIFKVDPNGNVIWTKKLGPFDGEPSDIQLAFDNGFILTGHSHHFGGNTGFGEMLIVKTDSNGIFQWAKSIRSLYGSTGTMITQTNDSCYIITGEAYMDNSEKRLEIPIIKIDNNGDTIWTKSIGQNHSDEKAYSIKKLHDNNFIIAGVTIKYDSLYYPISRDALIIKINQNADILWAKTFQNCEARDIIETNDNGFAFTGKAYDSLSANAVLINLDSIGNIIFSKLIGSSTFEDYGICIQQKNNGLFLIAGADRNNTLNTSHIFMIEFNQSGDSIWSKNYFYYSTMFGFYGPSFLVDGSSIFMGGIKNDNAPVDSYPYIFRLDTSGFSCQMSSYSPEINQGSLQVQNFHLDKSKGDTLYDAIINCTSFNPIENNLCFTTGITKEIINVDKNLIYPNPAENLINIKTAQNSIIEIFNINGQIIMSINNSSGETSIDIKDLSSGVYIIKVTTDKEIATKKFIKQ